MDYQRKTSLSKMAKYLLVATLVSAILIFATPLFPVGAVLAILTVPILLLIFFTELVIRCLQRLIFGRDEFEDLQEEEKERAPNRSS